MSGAPDPKPLDGRKRDRDPLALRIAAASNPECVACGAPGANAHHVLERDDGGDDVPENMVVLCGSGTLHCHGALHGNPYVAVVQIIPYVGDFATRPIATREERRDREWVARRIGRHLVEHRRDVIDYVIDRLGLDAGVAYLARYELDPVELYRLLDVRGEAIRSPA